MDKVTETIFRKNRFFVRIKDDKTYPRANYVWMKHNPSFQSIPKGYVIHHLDLDPTNDDPSNLVIMHKFHHVAYHFKHKEIVSEVTIDNGISREKFFIVPDYPKRRPTVCQRSDNHRWFFHYYAGDGSRKRISRYRNKPFANKEEAEGAIDKMFPHGFNS